MIFIPNINDLTLEQIPKTHIEVINFLDSRFLAAEIEIEMVLDDYKTFDFEKMKDEDPEKYKQHKDFLDDYKERKIAISRTKIEYSEQRKKTKIDLFKFLRFYKETYLEAKNVCDDYQEFDWDSLKKNNIKSYEEHKEFIEAYHERLTEIHKESKKRSLVFEEHEIKTNIEDSMKKLNQLTGLRSVKREVRKLVNEIKIKSLREQRGLASVTDRSYHMIFSGSPGTGKTMIARLISEIMYQLGVIQRNILIEVDRSDLVGEYIGATAKKTSAVIESALGGVLFIDEAYSLHVDSERDFGAEAIATLLKRMEDHRDELVVIVAGYSNEMKSFIESNSGLSSRFKRTIHFEDYDSYELFEIFKYICETNGYMINDEAEDRFIYFIEEIKNTKGDKFGNARDVRNLFEETISNQEYRLCALNNNLDILDNEDLLVIKNEDINWSIIAA